MNKSLNILALCLLALSGTSIASPLNGDVSAQENSSLQTLHSAAQDDTLPAQSGRKGG